RSEVRRARAGRSGRGGGGQGRFSAGVVGQRGNAGGGGGLCPGVFGARQGSRGCRLGRRIDRRGGDRGGQGRRVQYFQSGGVDAGVGGRARDETRQSRRDLEVWQRRSVVRAGSQSGGAARKAQGGA